MAIMLVTSHCARRHSAAGVFHLARCAETVGRRAPKKSVVDLSGHTQACIFPAVNRRETMDRTPVVRQENKEERVKTEIW